MVELLAEEVPPQVEDVLNQYTLEISTQIRLGNAQKIAKMAKPS
jgi:hypothetical protein